MDKNVVTPQKMNRAVAYGFAVLGVLLLTAIGIRSPRADTAAVAPLTVLSYNIRIGAGIQRWKASPYRLKNDATLDLKPIVAAIRSINPDIVGLQEVLGESQASELGESLGMHHAYVQHGIGRHGSWWGVAVLSKYPIQSTDRVQISSGRGNTKSMLVAAIDLGGRLASFISIHKDKDLDDGESLRVAMQYIGRIERPTVLIGDLNMEIYDERLEVLAPRFRDSADGLLTPGAIQARERGTWDSRIIDRPNRRIDYVFIDPSYWTVQDVGLLPTEHWHASDHIGYFARIVPRF